MKSEDKSMWMVGLLVLAAVSLLSHFRALYDANGNATAQTQQQVQPQPRATIANPERVAKRKKYGIMRRDR